MTGEEATCAPGECRCGFKDIAFPAMVRCTNPVCQMPTMALETVEDVTPWLRIHFLSGCQSTQVATQPKAEIEAQYRVLAEQGRYRHWELWFNERYEMLTADVYTGKPLGPTQYELGAEDNDPRGRFRVVVPHATMDGAQALARDVMRRALGTP